jgi:hypothetical protein
MQKRFGKFTTKMSHFGKFYHGFLEKLPFYGNISMEIDTLGKVPWINGNMPRGGGRQVKILNLKIFVLILKLKKVCGSTFRSKPGTCH